MHITQYLSSLTLECKQVSDSPPGQHFLVSAGVAHPWLGWDGRTGPCIYHPQHWSVQTLLTCILI